MPLSIDPDLALTPAHETLLRWFKLNPPKKLVSERLHGIGARLFAEGDIGVDVSHPSELGVTVKERGRPLQFTTEFWMRDGRLVAQCDCAGPAGSCVHVYVGALALRELEARPRPTPALSPTRATAPRPATVGLPPKTQPALEAWADKHGVRDLLALPKAAFFRFLDGEGLGGVIAESQVHYGGFTLAGFITRPPAWIGRKELLQEAARRYLVERARDRENWPERFRARRFPPANHPALRAHVAALLEERDRRIASGLLPLPEDEQVPHVVSLIAYPTTVTVEPQRSGWEYDEPPMLQITFEPGGEVRVGSNRGPHEAPTDSRRLTWCLEVLLKVLTEREPRDIVTKLVAELEVPPWTRVIRALEEPLAPGADAEAKVRPLVGWRITAKNNAEVALAPVYCTPKVRGGGFKVAQVPLDRWGADEHPAAHPGDAVAWAACVTLKKLAGWEPARLDLTQAAVEALVGHPRVFVREDKDRQVELLRGELALATRDHADGFEVGFEVGGRFRPGQEVGLSRGRFRLGHAALLVDDDEGRAWFCPLSASLAGAVGALLGMPHRLPREAAQPFLGIALAARRTMPIAISAGLRGDAIAADATVRLRLSLAGDVLTVEALVKPSSELATEIPGSGPETLYLEREGALVTLARDLAAEAEAAAQLWHRLGRAPALDFKEALPVGDDALDLVALAHDLEGLEVEWTTASRVAVTRPLDFASLKISARRGKSREWFELDGEAQVEGGGAVPLGEILRAVRERQRFVKVDGQRWAEIDETLARRLGAVAKRGGSVPSLMAPILAELEDDGAALEGAAELRAALTRLKKARSLVVAEPPGLEADLRPYQREGFAWLARLASWAPGACLADDMGLGKTVQALALLLHRRADGPALVVAPTSLGFNWAREAERFAPSLRLRPLRSGAEVHGLGALAPGDVVVTSYGVATQNAERLAGLRWGTLVVDEAQWVKNPATQRARALFGLEAKFVLALTGTPVENRASELWSLFRLIGPGLLGSAASFQEQYAGAIADGDELARTALAALISPFVLRRLKRDVAKDLPARTEVELEIVLGPKERARYDEIRKATLHLLDQAPESAGPQRQFKALQALTRLRQLACDPSLLDPTWDGGSKKLDALVDLLERLREEGHRALVFSQFTTFLAKARERVERLGLSSCYLDGQTPPSARQREVDRFQEGGADVFLLSLKAGGTGLNLTAATYVIHLDPWWNPAVEDQATDRAHRIGQDQPVTVYRLVAKDTVEEGILRLHAGKRELADALLAGTGSSAALSYDEVLALISGESLEHGVVDVDAAGEAEPVAGEPAPKRPAAGAKVVDLAAARARRGMAAPAAADPAPIPPEDGPEAHPAAAPERDTGGTATTPTRARARSNARAAGQAGAVAAPTSTEAAAAEPPPAGPAAPAAPARAPASHAASEAPRSPPAAPARAPARDVAPDAPQSTAEAAAAEVPDAAAAARFRATLDAAVASAELARSSADAYLRVGRRLLAFAAARRLPLAARSTLAAYEAALASGEAPGPQGAVKVARVVFGWIVRGEQAADAPPRPG